jgi:hypothetical protein
MESISYSLNHEIDHECIICLEETYNNTNIGNEHDYEHRDNNYYCNSNEELISIIDLKEKYDIQCNCTFKIHELCYVRWIAINPSCPICHMRLPRNEDVNININMNMENNIGPYNNPIIIPNSRLDIENRVLNQVLKMLSILVSFIVTIIVLYLIFR